MSKTFEEKLFPKLTDEQTQRLVPYGNVVEYSPGQTLFVEGSVDYDMFVILSGRVRVTRRAAKEEMELAIHERGDFTGEISMIAGDPAIATGTAVIPTRALRIARAAVSQALADNPDIRAVIVPAAAARRPEADAMVMQREKMAALGKLSAGLAHELNNPASAAARAAAQLEEIIVRQMSQAICLAGGCADEAEIKVRTLLQNARQANAAVTLGALERSDREEMLTDWMQQHGVKDPWQLAPDMVNAGVTNESLEHLTSMLDPSRTAKIIAWLGTTIASLSLVTQIEASTARMSDLIGAIKSFTYMDQAPIQDVWIHKDIDTTLTILAHKLKDIRVERDYDPQLPPVTGRGGDLNQVWANIIDNAIDAMRGSGVLTIRTRCDGSSAIVEISDTGTGIAPDVLRHVFDPFFTTKGVGGGTGLGLDTVYRIIEQHHGQITARSRPGETIFRIQLPFNAR